MSNTAKEIVVYFLVFTAQDEINPIFGTYLMVPGADYAQPLEGGARQIFNAPLSQSQRSVCYSQRTYEDMEVEGDEYFSLRVATEDRTPLNVVINEALNTTLIRIVDDDDDMGYRGNTAINPNEWNLMHFHSCICPPFDNRIL